MPDPYTYHDYNYNHLETQAEIHEEAADYNHGVAHANDDGWFYNDDGENELPNSDIDD